jgi:metal-responsive CopG/Arc/MetJ family transcriptional regulator
MAVDNRISVSLDDKEFLMLERLSAHTHMSKAALIRVIVEEFLRDNPDRFRRKNSIGLKRSRNIIVPDTDR